MVVGSTVAVIARVLYCKIRLQLGLSDARNLVGRLGPDERRAGLLVQPGRSASITRSDSLVLRWVPRRIKGLGTGDGIASATFSYQWIQVAGEDDYESDIGGETEVHGAGPGEQRRRRRRLVRGGGGNADDTRSRAAVGGRRPARPVAGAARLSAADRMRVVGGRGRDPTPSVSRYSSVGAWPAVFPVRGDELQRVGCPERAGRTCG